VKGAIDDTQLRIDGWDFLHIGFALERADATARLLDVKYYVLLPQVDYVGSGLDNYQWRTVLRAMSAHRAFNWAYGGEVTPHKIADFLILNRKSPRSLITSIEDAAFHLDRLARGYGRSTEAQGRVRAMISRAGRGAGRGHLRRGPARVPDPLHRRGGGAVAVIHRVYLSGEAR
jgi:uncharacterized alpha-E superfamily protein